MKSFLYAKIILTQYLNGKKALSILIFFYG